MWRPSGGLVSPEQATKTGPPGRHLAATCKKSQRFREAIANVIAGCPQNAVGALRNARFDAASKEMTGDAQYVKPPADTNDELQAHFWATIVLGDKGATVLKNSAQRLRPAALPTFRSERTERNDAEQRSRRPRCLKHARDSSKGRSTEALGRAAFFGG